MTDFKINYQNPQPQAIRVTSKQLSPSTGYLVIGANKIEKIAICFHEVSVTRDRWFHSKTSRN